MAERHRHRWVGDWSFEVCADCGMDRAQAREAAKKEKEMCDECFLCEKNAETPRGTAYYRFYNDAKPGWTSEPICLICLRKLKGLSEQEKEEARERADVEAQRMETYEGGPLPDANYFDHDI